MQPFVLAQLACPGCKHVIELTSNNTRIHVYTRHPRFNHLDLSCRQCNATLRFWPFEDDLDRAYANGFQVNPPDEAPSLRVVSGYWEQHDPDIAMDSNDLAEIERDRRSWERVVDVETFMQGSRV